MSVVSFLLDYKWVVSFYLLIFFLIYVFRKKFDVKGIVALYRTNFGLKFIDRISSKYGEFVKLVGYVGIGAGYVGLVSISFILLKNLYSLFTVPGASPALGLIIPGVKIPGSPIFLPFWYGIVALFVVVVVHEFAHGVIARAHGLKIKSSGFGLFAVFPIAFVEPDEKMLKKQSDVVQYSVFAAGPFFNVLTAVFVVLLLSFVFSPINKAITEPVGFSISGVQSGFPAELAGLKGGMIITSVNNVSTLSYESFSDVFSSVRPGEKVSLTANDSVFDLVVAKSPSDERKPYLGVVGLKDEVRLKSDGGFAKVLFSVFSWFMVLFQWIGVLSLGVGLANLLPLGPVDGGRMLQVSLLKIAKNKKKGNRIWVNISVICLLVLLLNLLFPLLKNFF